MKIYISGHQTVSFRVSKTDHYKIFRISNQDGKLALSGGWAKGAFGGNMRLEKAKLWSLFLRELKDATIHGNIEFID
mgnify:CR=1 FL=1